LHRRFPRYTLRARILRRQERITQIKAEGTIRQQAQIAASIYKGFGRWSSVCSAITCWASIVAEP